MRTITLEILRHGPPHNQLLSPLTQYLALCENHAAVSVTVPYEHAQFLHRLRALSYELDEAARRFQLDDTGREIGQLLARIPSLIAELTQRGKMAHGETLHLRMIVSASELALLPFELAISPNGFPGEARSLLLQTALPISLTREVRQASGVHPDWSRRPKILFAAASPPGVAPIPLESHTLALRRTIDPWVHHFATDEQRRAMVEKHLVVLPQATVEQIREQCATGQFTHVHLLAHGVAISPGNRLDYQYGLALHDARDPGRTSVVDGRTLARVLRTDQSGCAGPAQPLVVTLASCNSGGVGSVADFAGSGASVAHALHAEGIPLVIASQFPLSFRGSVRMVEVLYPGLLDGEDPRCILHDLRGQLQALIPEAHDWGSVVAYAALEGRFEREIERFQVDQSHRRMNAALDHADRVMRWEDDEGEPLSVSAEDLKAVQDRVEYAKRRLKDLRAKAVNNLQAVAGLAETTEQRDQRARVETHLAYVSGLIAAADKRHSELISEHLFPSDPGTNRTPYSERRQLLERALDSYWDAYFYDRSNVWALVQHIFVQCVLTQSFGNQPEKLLPVEREKAALWGAALNASLADTRSHDTERELWARANLLELSLLKAQAASLAKGQGRKAGDTGDMLEHVARILVLTRRTSVALYSIRRQIRRYANSNNGFSAPVIAKAKDFAQKLRIAE
ncbi:MAG TPA: CHAT domain-containing protein [Verrucomicrobiota bacterium]|nr:CHAT domain-containing protein [Verrucomicrobiota bacterium]